MKKRLIIFDLDGTLLNTIADIASATNAALLKLGYPTHSDSVIQSFVGNGIGKLLERALPEDKRTEENKNIISIDVGRVFEKNQRILIHE